MRKIICILFYLVLCNVIDVSGSQQQFKLPFNGDLDNNLKFLLSIHENVNDSTLYQHIETLFSEKSKSTSGSEMIHYCYNLIDSVSNRENVSQKVKFLLLQKSTDYLLTTTGRVDKNKIKDGLAELLNTCQCMKRSVGFISFVNQVDENTIDLLGDDLYIKFCNESARAYNQLGQKNLANYWSAKADFKNNMTGAVQGQSDIGLYSVLFLIFFIFFFIWLVVDNMVSIDENDLITTYYLPGKLKKNATVVWGIISQLFFVLYIISQKIIVGHYQDIFFPFALMMATQLLIFAYYKFYIQFEKLNVILKDLFDLKEEWLEENKKRLINRKATFCIGIIWAITVSVFVSSIKFEGYPLMKIILGIYIFYINFWTGIFVYEVAILAYSIVKLDEFEFKHLVGSKDNVFFIGSLILKLSITLIIYMCICLGSFKASGISGIEMYFSIYLSLSVIGVIIFFFGIPIFLHRKLIDYRNHHTTYLKKELSSKLFKMINQKGSEIDEIASINENYDSLIEKVKDIPAWPYDFKIVSSFFSMIVVPIIMIIFDIITNTESIFYNTTAITRIVTFFESLF